MTPEAEQLLEEARRLDAQSITVGEDTLPGRTLRAQAAARRVEAVGPRPYPVLVCGFCFTLTGWLDERGACDRCGRRAARLAAEAASGGWYKGTVDYPHAVAPPPLPLSLRLASWTGRRAKLSRARTLRWLEQVEPDQTGPIEPETGFELEGAFRDEAERVDHRGVIVRFTTATLRFGEEGWQRLAGTRYGRSLLALPAEFAAELPIETLAEAWGDYRSAVVLLNRTAWAATSRERAQAADAEQLRAEKFREQHDTSALLGE